jgi:hypothetical protein
MLTLAAFVPCLGAKERKGARIEVLRRDGLRLSGELLAVKNGNLVLLDLSTSREVTESLLDCETIVVPKKSKRAIIVVAAAVAGGILGVVIGPDKKPDPNEFRFWNSPVAQGALGVLTGLGLAYWITKDNEDHKEIRFKVTDPASIAEVSARLRRYARDRGK